MPAIGDGMIQLVLPETRFSHAAALMQMHHDRKRVFVDQLGWNLPSPSSWLEVDDFDSEHAIYLLALSPAGHHEGSLRLLPSLQNHLLGALFPDLCEQEVPRGEDCWEISRLVAAPSSKAGTSILRLHRILALALVEFALLNDIRRYTLVAEAHRVPTLLSVGWRVRPLGLPRIIEQQQLQALEILVEPETLLVLRRKYRVSASVLQSPQPDREAA